MTDKAGIDRDVAGRMLEQDPGLRDRVRDNREFVTGVARLAAERGIAQFIDLGAGLVILAAVAHFLPAAQAAAITAGFTRPLAAGSWLAISVAHFTDEELLARLYALHTTAPFQNHGTEPTGRVSGRA